MAGGYTYSKTTRDITVNIQPNYLAEKSTPHNHEYTWSYHVLIENMGERTVQILSRHWKITDTNGASHEVIGNGLVGQQPVLKPGETFEYTSGTPLKTPSGFMSGSFFAVTGNGEHFDVVAPAFSLDSSTRPSIVH